MYTPTGGEAFMFRLREGYAQWSVGSDAAGFQKGRMPKQVARAMRSNFD